MKYIAHRGVRSSSVKENTIDAFKLAINSDKFDGFEFDVRVTKDNVFVIHHDPIIKGRLVKNVLYKDISDSVVKLVDVLKLDTDKIFLIEIKEFDIDLKRLRRIINKYSNKKLYVMSFSKSFLHRFYKYNPKCKLGVLNYVINSDDSYDEYDFICLMNGLTTDRLIDYFNSKNIEVFIYGIIDKKKMTNNDVFYIIDEYLK